MLNKKEIAERRIKKLFVLAEEELRRGNFDRVKRYIELARKIGMKCQYTIPRDLKRKICKKCNMLLIPELSCDKEFKDGFVILRCLFCNNVRKYSEESPEKDKK